MGNCNKNAGGRHKTTAPATGMLNTNMVHERTGDVLTKYEVIRTIGEGSMGAISKARIKDHKKGGSAYNPEPQNVTQMFTHGSESVQLKPEGRRQASVYYALKTIQLARVTPEFIDELRNEIALLKSMDHPNIVKAYEVYERKTQIYIVMELCSGGYVRPLVYSRTSVSTFTT
jgi:serine/threonine protein kinase